jgi:hypothetical protein
MSRGADQAHRKYDVLLVLLGLALVLPPLNDGQSLNRFFPQSLMARLLLSSGLWPTGLQHPWLSSIGDHLFSIFLFHVFFTLATRIVMHILHWDNPIRVLPVSLPLGLWSPVWVQKIDARSHLFSRYVLATPVSGRAAA